LKLIPRCAEPVKRKNPEMVQRLKGSTPNREKQLNLKNAVFFAGLLYTAIYTLDST
jgi:hypothetical protein